MIHYVLFETVIVLNNEMLRLFHLVQRTPGHQTLEFFGDGRLQVVCRERIPEGKIIVNYHDS